MRTVPESLRLPPRAADYRRSCSKGFSLIELLIGMSIMSIALLSIASMFATGYTDVTAGGKTTMATAAARQMLEDIQSLPFNNLGNLNNTGTNSTADLPAANPERDLVRKWRYALAGDDVAWGFTGAEKAKWSALTVSGVSLGGTGRITVVDQDFPVTLRLVTVTVTVPGRPSVQFATLISRL